MQGMETFEYAIIRYVPRVERGEFINVGVIVFSKRKKYLQVKYKLDEDRITSFYDEAELSELANYLNTWVLISTGDAEGGPIAKFDLPYRFRWLTAARSTIIQSSSVHSGLTDNPEKMLEDLFIKYVL